MGLNQRRRGHTASAPWVGARARRAHRRLTVAMDDEAVRTTLAPGDLDPWTVDRAARRRLGECARAAAAVSVG